jgi:Na+-driven multidrug efflux pump
MLTSVVDGGVGLILTYILVWRFGIYGFVIGNCVQDLLAFLMNFTICLYQIKNIRP